MPISPLLPNTAELRLDHLLAEPQAITVVVATVRSTACCPTCQHLSTRVHSRYVRTLADLPWSGTKVRLRLHTRRFFCSSLTCSRRIFTERLPATVAPYARRTLRLNDALRLIGLVAGGEAGARLASLLGMAVSGDTVRHRIRHGAARQQPTPRVLGVDDWAWRKGHSYGTILCDLERKTVVDLLPDRTAESFATWLKQRPGIAFIARDRAGVYAEGARQGAPTAMQVADRWHLLRNLTEALEGILRSRQGQIREAARRAAALDPPLRSSQQIAESQPLDLRPRTRAEQIRQERRALRWARYQEVVRLYQQGATMAAISRQLGLGYHTVLRWLRAGQFPEWTVPERPSALRPFLPYLEKRWAEGCHNAARLWREICQQGYTGRGGLVRQWIGRWKRQLPRDRQHAATRCATPVPQSAVPTLRRVTWMLLRADAKKLSASDQTFLTTLRQQCPEIAQAALAATEFMRIVRKRDAMAWPAWREQARITLLARFAEHLGRDEAAVIAALKTPWSNGHVEGQVHRLKLIKRQGYGRAHFDLLKQRVLHQAA